MTTTTASELPCSACLGTGGWWKTPGRSTIHKRRDDPIRFSISSNATFKECGACRGTGVTEGICSVCGAKTTHVFDGKPCCEPYKARNTNPVQQCAWTVRYGGGTEREANRLQARDLLRLVTDKEFGTVRTDYSGRFMYGKTCLSVTTDRPQCLIKSAWALGIYGERTDQMGFDTVVYWPDLGPETYKEGAE